MTTLTCPAPAAHYSREWNRGYHDAQQQPRQIRPGGDGYRLGWAAALQDDYRQHLTAAEGRR